MTQAIVTVEVQGSLVKAAVHAGGASCGGLRGRVSGLSRAARKRLLETVARLSDQLPLFLTLTMAVVVPPAEMKRNLDVFWKRLKREHPLAAAVWRFAMESQGEREYHPHFHLLLYGVAFLPFEWIADAWREICGPAGGYVFIERWSARKAALYLGRYVSVEDEQRSLDYLAYLTGERWTGRMWGVLGRADLPWAVKQVVEMTLGGWFWDLKRSARRVWSGVSKDRLAGFTLFRDGSDAWLNLAYFYALA